MSPREEAEWVQHFKDEMAAVGIDPTYEQIQMLCNLAASDSESEGAAEIRALAWSRLQQIPDFPDRIYDHVIAAKNEWDREKGNPYNYNRSRAWGLSRLGDLPHHGSVRVLGEFLYDDELPGYASELEAAINGDCQANCIIAMRSLGRLVDMPPVQGDPDTYSRNDLRAWQLWFEQLKAGSRRFRLKGNPQEYSLAGPIEAALPLNVTRPESMPASEQASATDERGSKGPLVALMAAIGLLAVAIATVARKKAART